MAEESAKPMGSASDKRLRQEYARSGAVASGYMVLAGNRRPLPHWPDDVARDYGIETYEKMAADPAVSHALVGLKSHILSVGLQLYPVKPKPELTDPNFAQAEAEYTKAVEIRDFCQRMIDDLPGAIESTFEQMLESICYGYQLAELTYEVRGNTLALKSIHDKPQKSTLFVVDAFNNILGIHPAIGLPTGMSGSQIDKNRLVPREKFWLATFRGRWNDPRGRSAFRTAYNAWNAKMNFVYPSYIKYIDQFGGGIVWGAIKGDLAAGGYGPDLLLEQGVKQYDDAGNLQTKSASQELSEIISKATAGHAVWLPDGGELHIDRPTDKGEVFTAAFDFFNREIVYAIMSTVRATMESQHGSKADSETSQDVLGHLVNLCRKWIADSFRSDVLCRIVAYNFGKEIADEFTPIASLSMLSPEDIARQMEAASKVGFKLRANQESHFARLWGLPDPDPDAPYAGVGAAPETTESVPPNQEEDEEE